MPKWVAFLVGKFLKSKLDVQEDKVTDTKKWWTSQTVLSGIAIGLVNLYELAAFLGPNFGYHLPAIPETVFTLLNSFLGGSVVHGRFTATSKIG